MARDEPAPEPTETEFDAQIARAGLELTPIERDNVLVTARYLRRSVARVRSYNTAAQSTER